TNYNLTKLNLSWNKIRGKGSVALLRAFEVNTGVKDLNLSWNGLGYDGCVALRRIFRINGTITRIDITNNNIEWKGAKLIAQGLAKNSTLETLLLAFNPLTTHGVHSIIRAVNSKECTLSLLNLSGLNVYSQTVRLAEKIAMRRRFVLKYDFEVDVHDTYGTGNPTLKPDSLRKIINHIDNRNWRTIEYFRIMDKPKQNKIDNENIPTNIMKTGVQLKSYEIRDVTRRFTEHIVEELTYKDLNKILNKQKLQERIERNKHENMKKALKRKNLKILQSANEHFPEIPISKLNKQEQHAEAIKRLAIPKTYHND
ncbi:unnamed protein product, partial [Didymodactylos carnosus]